MLPSGRYARTSDWYSHTTTRHINKWLQGVTADVLEHPEEWFRNLVEIRYREPEAPASEHEEEQRATTPMDGTAASGKPELEVRPNANAHTSHRYRGDS